jgi:hypothetical protein
MFWFLLRTISSSTHDFFCCRPVSSLEVSNLVVARGVGEAALLPRHRSHVVRPFFPICGTNHCLVVYSIQGSGELISTHTMVSDLTGFSHIHGNTSRLFLPLYEFLPGRSGVFGRAK